MSSAALLRAPAIFGTCSKNLSVFSIGTPCVSSTLGRVLDQAEVKVKGAISVMACVPRPPFLTDLVARAHALSPKDMFIKCWQASFVVSSKRLRTSSWRFVHAILCWINPVVAVFSIRKPIWMGRPLCTSAVIVLSS